MSARTIPSHDCGAPGMWPLLFRDKVAQAWSEDSHLTNELTQCEVQAPALSGVGPSMGEAGVCDVSCPLVETR